MNAISPLDGRYAGRVAHLGRFFSEAALVRARCLVELRYLGALESARLVPPFAPEERERIDAALSRCDPDQDLAYFAAWFEAIQTIEARTRHDVKAVEVFLAQELGLTLPGLVHLGLTSEDTNNLAYSLLLGAFVRQEQLPQVRRLMAALADLVNRWRDEPFPTRTHGQPASPSTAGKEMAVFLDRLVRLHRPLAALEFRGKLAGATGTYAAWTVAFPGTDPLAFAERFVTDLGLVPSLVCTQIEDHDTWAEYFQCTARIHTVVLDLDRDLWEYISRGWIRQRAVPGEVGSSTMPHKVNPIRFENSEGNLALANAHLGFLAGRLGTSRMQRDLTDSTVERTIGVALSHGWFALDQTIEGLAAIGLDREACREDLAATPEVLAEAYQAVLRAAGVADAYDRLKQATRGQTVTRETLDATLDGLSVPDPIRERLARLRPDTYTGEASRLCGLVLDRWREEVPS
ncbi:MAG: adenylosuccinate lyase [Deltaproteobacteria bacterium]|nr:adenylosuccinate lyase [Deltaproteobacteria bacterium]